MQRLLIFGLCIFIFACVEQTALKPDPSSASEPQKAEYALVIHGGAGTIRKDKMTPERAAGIREAMNAALDAGEKVLSAGGSAADAVEQTIWVMEDSPYFNSGKGAVFTNAGTNELDASFMTGHDREAGAVGGVTNIKHPISAARAVLEKSEHVLLTGTGAEAFAANEDIELVDPAYFYTEERFQSLQRVKEKEAVLDDKDVHGSLAYSREVDEKFGTVGCVALDKNGNIAAGTSTGGMTNKRYNRFGDSPIIGAGTYADNNTCGVSCTGHGEFFIRYAVAHDVHARMAYAGNDLAAAANAVVFDVLEPVGGSGGLIALDKYGNIAMPFNTAGMYRGYARAGEERSILFYGEE